MSLKLMYITNNPEVAMIVQEAGVDRIFLDMEYIWKEDRQGGMNTVQFHHTVEDIQNLRKVVEQSELLVRINPIHEEGSYLGVSHTSSIDEINAVIEAGADVIMLPYFKTLDEIHTFVNTVAGRTKTMLLLETVEAEKLIDEILEIDGIDEIHIGLNDLSLEQGKTFMFQLVADGTVEKLCDAMAKKGMSYGFGGIAAPGAGMLPAEFIIRDHYHYGSTCVILSRSFCNCEVITDFDEIREIFRTGVKAIRDVEKECETYTEDEYNINHTELQKRVQMVVDVIEAKKTKK